MIDDYAKFIESKTQLDSSDGFDPTFMPDKAFGFQRFLIEWAVRKGRAGIFAGCGLGKSLMELAWAQNVVEHTNRPVLIATPLCVGPQFIEDGGKFGVDCQISRDGKFDKKIVITNYQNLHKFNPSDFAGMSGDESGILKNFSGATKSAVVEFMRKMRYRLLGTATPSPNDYIELGNSSEALGYLGYMDMLGRFFKTTDGGAMAGGGAGGGAMKRHNADFYAPKFRFRGHAEHDFWRWVVSWARAIERPSDLGFSNDGYILPPLRTIEHVVKSTRLAPGMIIPVAAHGLSEQREERRRTIQERCEKAAEIALAEDSPCVSWCSLNDEGDLLTDLIPGAVQICGNDSDEKKEESLMAFRRGEITRLVSKSSITGWGMNWQHCYRTTMFPSHSFEQWFQSVRRFWRFGQTKPVQVHMIASEGEMEILKNLERKTKQAETMFAQIVSLMNDELKINRAQINGFKITKPLWLQNK